MSIAEKIGICFLLYLILTQTIAIVYIILARREYAGHIAGVIARSTGCIIMVCAASTWMWPAFWRDISKACYGITDTEDFRWTAPAICWYALGVSAMIAGSLFSSQSLEWSMLYGACCAAALLLYRKAFNRFFLL